MAFHKIAHFLHFKRLSENHFKSHVSKNLPFFVAKARTLMCDCSVPKVGKQVLREDHYTKAYAAVMFNSRANSALLLYKVKAEVLHMVNTVHFPMCSQWFSGKYCFHRDKLFVL